MKTYYIFRHGETFASKLNCNYGDQVRTASILEEGYPAIERMGKYLKTLHTDYNVSSEFLRCRQTVDIISKESGKKFVFDSRLNEYIDTTFKHMKERITEFLERIEHTEKENILICTHGAVIAGLSHLLTEGDFKQDQTFDYPQPGVLLIIKGNRIERINFNKPKNVFSRLRDQLIPKAY